MPMNLNKITALDRLTNTALLLSPQHAKNIFTYLAKRNDVDLIDGEGQQVGAVAKMLVGKPRSRDSMPYQITGDGVAVVSVDGSLAHRFGYLTTRSGITGYDGIEGQLLLAERDDDVKGVFFDICSGGGEVSGCFELGEIIQGYSKPTFGYSDGYSYSAAYALLSSCDKTATSKNGGVGSIGVIAAHWDYSELIKESYKSTVTLVYSGAHKADGNSYGKLPKAVEAKWQSTFDGLRSDFCEHVAVKRSISKKQALKTEADTYRGQEALSIGLVDLVMGKQEALAYFSKTLSHESTTIEGSSQMSKKDNTRVDANAEAPEATPSTEVPSNNDVVAEAKAELHARMSSVITSDAVVGKEKLATFLLAESDMPADKIIEAVGLVDLTTTLELSGAGIESDENDTGEEAKLEHPALV